MRCQATKRDGTRCKANALVGEKHCALHSDSKRAAELGRRGGRRRTVFKPDNLMFFAAPKNAGDVRDLLAQSMVDVRSCQLEPQAAKCICELASEFLKSLEMCTIEDVIEPIERERAQTGGFQDVPNRKQENSFRRFSYDWSIFLIKLLTVSNISCSHRNSYRRVCTCPSRMLNRIRRSGY
jgi:hypothetical protein